MKLLTCLFACLPVVAACGASPSPDVGSEEDDVTRARTQLRIPILDEAAGKPLAEKNAQLTAAGARTFPEYMDLDGRGFEKWSALHDVVDEANTKLGTSLELKRQASPLEYGQNATKGLCYKGNVRKIPALVRDMNDWIFDEFISVYQWKYKAEVHNGDAWGEFNEPENPSSYPQAFRDFHGHGEDLMLVVSTGDDYANRLAVTIPRCQ